jgi:hypothetical protein
MNLSGAFAARTTTPASKLVLLAMVHLARREADRVLCDAPPSRIADLAGLDSEELHVAMVDLVRLELVRDTGERQGRDRTRVYQLAPQDPSA